MDEVMSTVPARGIRGEDVLSGAPRVSAVIPTAGRPDLVTRAVESVLAQTLRELEAVVVIDGPDIETADALARIQDDRLRIVALPANMGLGAAINAGVAAARGEWIALLDDDDVWLPSKLEAQLACARTIPRSLPIVATSVCIRTEYGDLCFPRRRPDEGEPICEYLFGQRGLRGGEGYLAPSSLLVRRELLVAVPFRSGLPRHNDIDWLLRAATLPDVGVAFVERDEPLSTIRMRRARRAEGTGRGVRTRGSSSAVWVDAYAA
jgi:glycosyltransferase involved in cell wall biosynthesis